jgi:hypothetical protein
MSKVVIGGQEIDKSEVVSASTRNTSVQIKMKGGSLESINLHTEIAAQKAVELLSSEESASVEKVEKSDKEKKAEAKAKAAAEKAAKEQAEADEAAAAAKQAEDELAEANKSEESES